MRRRTLLAAIGASVGIGLAGCGRRDSAAPSEGAAATTPPNVAKGDAELHLYNWNNYLAEETAKRFEEHCRCRLVQDYFSDNEELLAKLAAGATGYDLLIPTGNAVETLIAQRVLRELDHAKIKGLDNIKPQFLDLFYDPGNRYSIPYAYSVTLIGYNEQRIRELGLPTDTWALIFEPKLLERIAGKITVLDSQRELFAAALMYLGYPANETDEGRLREARDVILRAKPYWAAFNASSYIKELTIGNIWVAHGYSNDMFQADSDAIKANRPFRIGSSTPKEGAVLAVDNMVMYRSGPRPDLAYEFINFMLVGRNSAELSNMLGSGNPNAAAMPYIDPAVRDNVNVFPPPADFRRLQMLKDYGRRERRLLNRLWTEVKVR
jgi:spermidine/putrescine transport system substrate-binding protein